MTDENFTGVRATTADEEAVMFRKSWIKAERENAALREENARLRKLSCNLIRKDECDALREENARLREALRPFAAAAEDLDEDDKDNLPIWEHWAAGSVEIGHLRAAAAAIREGDKNDPE